MSTADLITIPVGHFAESAGTDEDFWGVLPQGPASGAKFKLVGVQIIPHTTSAADGSNYGTLTVYGQDGSTAQATRATSSTALTAGTVAEPAITGGTNAEFDPSDSVKVSWANTGTGVAIDASVQLQFRAFQAV